MISYHYYAEDVTARNSVILIFATIGLYYTRRFFKNPHQPTETMDVCGDISRIVMLNESGHFIKQWEIKGNSALLIGKNTKNKEVDIDLSDSMYDALIQDEHAVLNFAVGSWYLEGLHTPSSISIKKTNDKMRYRLIGSRPCKMEQGDIVYIANTRLLMK